MWKSRRLTTGLLVVLLTLVILNVGIFLGSLKPKLNNSQIVNNDAIDSPKAVIGSEINQIQISTNSAALEQLPENINKIPVTSSDSCDISQDVCFADEKLEYVIQEGYEEYDRYWINKEIWLRGKGSTGFRLEWEGDKEVKLYFGADNFSDDQQLPVYLMLEKDISVKKTYQGKLILKSLATGHTKEKRVKINYIDPNPNLVRANKNSIDVTCKLQKNNFSGYIDCGDIKEAFEFMFYWWGKHESIEIRTEFDEANDPDIGILAKFANRVTTTTSFENLTPVWINFYQKSKTITEWRASENRGNFVLVDQLTQKELLRVPYNIKVVVL